MVKTQNMVRADEKDWPIDVSSFNIVAIIL